MESKEIRVRFLNGRFVPLNSVSFKDGEIIEIEIVSRGSEKLSWRGALKSIKKNSVALQHEIKDEW